MKQQGKFISGNPICVDRYTADWPSVKIHPSSYYRRQDEIIKGLNKSSGLYTELDMGQYIIVRFAEKDDMTSFYRRHHEYV